MLDRFDWNAHICHNRDRKCEYNHVAYQVKCKCASYNGSEEIEVSIERNVLSPDIESMYAICFIGKSTLIHGRRNQDTSHSTHYMTKQIVFIVIQGISNITTSKEHKLTIQGY